MLQQWKDELESCFGLTFQILDRTYVETVRRERGYVEGAGQVGVPGKRPNLRTCGIPLTHNVD